MKKVALGVFLLLSFGSIAGSPCQNPYCMFMYLGYQGMTNYFPVVDINELFQDQLKKDEAVCFSRKELSGSTDGDLTAMKESLRRSVQVRHDLMMSLFEFERTLCDDNVMSSDKAVEKLCRQLKSTKSPLEKEIPYWAVCKVELSFARLVLTSRIRDESILTSVLSNEILGGMSFVGEKANWRIRRFRDLLVCAVRVMSFRRSHGYFPSCKDDFIGGDELFAKDVVYDSRSDAWQVRVGSDGEASAEFDVYVPSVLNPAGTVKTRELRLSSSFNEKRRQVFLCGKLYEENPVWACYVDHLRAHGLSWFNPGTGGLWELRDADTGEATLDRSTNDKKGR